MFAILTIFLVSVLCIFNFQDYNHEKVEIENKLSRIYNLENKSLVGNIYVGYVKDIVKNLNAAFVEIIPSASVFFRIKSTTISLLLRPLIRST